MEKLAPYIPPSLKAFLLTVGLFLVAGLGLWLAYGYQDSFLLLNGSWGLFADAFFFFFTHLADGLVAFSLIVVLGAWWKLRFIGIALYGFVITGLAAQLLKRLVFSDWHRPVQVFGQENILLYKDYVLHSHSMPSGHATTAVVLGYLIALLFPKDRFIGILAALLAVGIAFSRVYLGIHFLGDIVSGMGLGLGLMLLLRALKFERFFVSLEQYHGNKMPSTGHGLILVLGLILGGVGYAMAAF